MEKKTRIKGLDRLLQKAKTHEDGLQAVGAKLESWGVQDVGSQVLSMHIAQLKAAGFRPKKPQAVKPEYVEGQVVAVKPEAMLGLLSAYYGDDATGEELEGLAVVKVVRKGEEKNSPRQVICQAKDGRRIVVSPSQIAS